MIRADREITDRAEQLAIMDACDVCRVALNGADCFPYIVPLNFGVEVEGDQVYLYFHSANRGESSTSSRATPTLRSRWTATITASSTTSA